MTSDLLSCTAVDRLFDCSYSCCSAQFDQESAQFWLVLTGNLEKSGKSFENPLETVLLALPSVKHFKKYEKGGFLRSFINMYDMGA